MILNLEGGLKYINNADVEYIDGLIVHTNLLDGQRGNDQFLVTVKMRSGAEFRFLECRANYNAMVKAAGGQSWA
jgi:hypothetical protein